MWVLIEGFGSGEGAVNSSVKEKGTENGRSTGEGGLANPCI